MADACNTGDELTIELSANDSEHLLLMKKHLCANHPISYRTRNKSKMVSLRIASRYLCQQLNKWGCIPNKSFSLQYPNSLPKEFRRDFIRGFFDGDGCIYIRSDEKSKIFSMYSVSLSFLMKIKSIIEEELKVELHHYTQDNGHIISAMKKG
jgi:intein/homing endonuclease